MKYQTLKEKLKKIAKYMLSQEGIYAFHIGKPCRLQQHIEEKKKTHKIFCIIG